MRTRRDRGTLPSRDLTPTRVTILPLEPSLPLSRLHQHQHPTTNKFASRIGRHSVTTMQPIFHRNYHRGLPLGSLHTGRDAKNEAGARGDPASCSLFRFLSLSVFIALSLSLFLSLLDVYIRHGSLESRHLHTRPSWTFRGSPPFLPGFSNPCTHGWI